MEISLRTSLQIQHRARNGANPKWLLRMSALGGPDTSFYKELQPSFDLTQSLKYNVNYITIPLSKLLNVRHKWRTTQGCTKSFKNFTLWTWCLTSSHSPLTGCSVRSRSLCWESVWADFGTKAWRWQGGQTINNQHFEGLLKDWNSLLFELRSWWTFT